MMPVAFVASVVNMRTGESVRVDATRFIRDTQTSKHYGFAGNETVSPSTDGATADGKIRSSANKKSTLPDSNLKIKAGEGSTTDTSTIPIGATEKNLAYENFFTTLTNQIGDLSKINSDTVTKLEEIGKKMEEISKKVKGKEEEEEAKKEEEEESAKKHEASMKTRIVYVPVQAGVNPRLDKSIGSGYGKMHKPSIKKDEEEEEEAKKEEEEALMSKKREEKAKKLEEMKAAIAKRREGISGQASAGQGVASATGRTLVTNTSDALFSQKMPSIEERPPWLQEFLKASVEATEKGQTNSQRFLG